MPMELLGYGSLRSPEELLGYDSRTVAHHEALLAFDTLRARTYCERSGWRGGAQRRDVRVARGRHTSEK